MAAAEVKTVDAKGRLTLGKEFASSLVIVQELAEGLVQVVRAEAVPKPEAWLYKNPKALAAIMEGLEQARSGDLVEGPDLDADADRAGG